MLESGLSGSVRGVPSNGHPYRDPGPRTYVCWKTSVQRSTGSDQRSLAITYHVKRSSKQPGFRCAQAGNDQTRSNFGPPISI
jgi:hypothetical protein